MSNYDSTNTNRKPRRRKKNRDFEPSDKLAQVWADLKGYGVYTHDRQGNVYDWATSRKQCNKRLADVKRKFNLSDLNATRDALLGVEDLFNGDLDNTALTPVHLRREIQLVQLVRTIALTSKVEDVNAFAAELSQKNMRELREMRGEVRDRIWGEDRAALKARIQKAINKGKKKGKIRSVKKGKKSRQKANV